jgi:hypothetical protein
MYSVFSLFNGLGCAATRLYNEAPRNHGRSHQLDDAVEPESHQSDAVCMCTGPQRNDRFGCVVRHRGHEQPQPAPDPTIPVNRTAYSSAILIQPTHVAHVKEPAQSRLW